jgi:translation initiation factor IF-2
VSNPKVFEFAKEVGMTPLALMDKIKEWQLPVKNHMAELNSEILSAIKAKLSDGGEDSSDDTAKKTATKKKPAKPKATVAKKTTVKKASSKAASMSIPQAENKASKKNDSEPETQPVAVAPAGSVIRRKTKEIEPISDTKAKVISKPEVDPPQEVTTAVVVEAPAATVIVSRPKTPDIAAPVEVATEAVTKNVAKTAKVGKAETATVIVDTALTATTPVVPSRKKEVAIGDSGIASTTNVRRNIIGRMDLSRVQAPQGSGGYSQGRPMSGPRAPGGGFQGQRPAQPGGFNTQRPGGTVASGRNIRPGFVAAAVIPEPGYVDYSNDAKRDFDKKAKKNSAPVTGGLSAKEKEQAELLTSFNAVEFRKREMVFQPKKKQIILNRNAKKTELTTPKASKRVLKVNGKMKLSDVANEVGLKAAQLIKVLMKSGVMANMMTELDFDTIALTLPEFGWEAQNVFKTADERAVETAFGNLDAELVSRPPVITVMGHVDHGKTSLLDSIRNASVATGEAGGITQHIGAYSVKTEDGSLLTFLDTPGHEAFTAMRARGANATDIVVIVVAADDGMMPQTAEAINHAKAAGVPMIVAVNKMDKPGANPERIKQQLTEFEIVPEEWGGTTIFCEVSALKKTGIKELLENIKLLSEVAELKANPERSGTGIVIEAKLEKGKGPVATILVKDGHVKVGQYIVAGDLKGRIKSLVNDKGERVERVTPGLPAEVLGLEGVPGAGDRFDIVIDEKTAEEVIQIRKTAALDAIGQQKKVTLEELFAKVTQGDVKDFNIVLKSDVHGSLEAITGMITKLNSKEVKNKIIHAAVGGITENDVMLAHTAKGIVIGFNVKPDNNAAAKAKQIGVDVRTYSIVYEMVDELKKAMQGLLTPELVEKAMGSAEVRDTFSVPKIGVIAGCFVTMGKIQRSHMLRLVRGGKIIHEGKVSSLKRFKDDVKDVVEGFECGIGIEDFVDIKTGDVIESFIKEEVARELTPL